MSTRLASLAVAWLTLFMGLTDMTFELVFTTLPAYTEGVPFAEWLYVVLPEAVMDVILGLGRAYGAIVGILCLHSIARIRSKRLHALPRWLLATCISKFIGGIVLFVLKHKVHGMPMYECFMKFGPMIFLESPLSFVMSRILYSYMVRKELYRSKESRRIKSKDQSKLSLSSTPPSSSVETDSTADSDHVRAHSVHSDSTRSAEERRQQETVHDLEAPDSRTQSIESDTAPGHVEVLHSHLETSDKDAFVVIV